VHFGVKQKKQLTGDFKINKKLNKAQK